MNRNYFSEKISARFEVPIATLMTIQVYWDVTSCRLVNSELGGWAVFVPEDYGARQSRVRNVGNYLPVDGGKHIRNHEFSKPCLLFRLCNIP
jgi:hypothetical protein